jgi:hypothetical protein
MIFLSRIYDLWTRYLDPATFQALRRTVDSLGQDIEPAMTEDWVYAVFPLPLRCFIPGIIPDRHRPTASCPRTSSGSTIRPGRILGDAATSESSSGVVLPRSRENESSHKTAVQASSASRPIVTESS